MKVVGLFAGIGGLELGLKQAGHEAILFSEFWEPAAAVLKARFPEVENVGDVALLKRLPPDTELLKPFIKDRCHCRWFSVSGPKPSGQDSRHRREPIRSGRPCLPFARPQACAVGAARKRLLHVAPRSRSRDAAFGRGVRGARLSLGVQGRQLARVSAAAQGARDLSRIEGRRSTRCFACRRGAAAFGSHEPSNACSRVLLDRRHTRSRMGSRRRSDIEERLHSRDRISPGNHVARRADRKT